MDAIWQAAADGDVHAMGVLIWKHGSSALDVSDDHGRTLAHVAAAEGRGDVLEAIARWGGTRLDTVDHNGLTPLCVAVLAMFREEADVIRDADGEKKRGCIRMLRALGANVELGLWRLPPFWGWHLHDAVEVETVMAIRYRVYFAPLLLDRLLLALNGRAMGVVVRSL